MNKITKTGLQGVWKMLYQEEIGIMILSPYGGRMNEILETKVPFPHRKRNLYKFNTWLIGMINEIGCQRST